MSNTEQVMDTIQQDLTARADRSDLSSRAGATSISEQRDALDSMFPKPPSSESSLPQMVLVEHDAAPNSVDSLGAAEIEVGGYNAFIGSKVPSGAVGVQTLFGRVYPEPLAAGWHFKNPLSTVEMMSTRLIANTVRAQASSHDLQLVTTQLTVPFSMKPEFAPKVFDKIGNLDKVEAVVINPGVLESVKAVAARYTAEQLITKREEVKKTTESLLKEYIHTTLKEKGIDGAINVGNIAITHFSFSDEFNRSIELKVKAEQDALRAENEKKQKITEAEATRESEKTKADGDAYATKVRSQADADGIRIRAEALKAGPGVVDLEAIKKWDGKLPVYAGSAPVPFINVDRPKSAEASKPAEAQKPVEAKNK